MTNICGVFKYKNPFSTDRFNVTFNSQKKTPKLAYAPKTAQVNSNTYLAEQEEPSYNLKDNRPFDI